MEIEWMKKIHPALRWILVAPTMMIDYLLVLFIINILLAFFIGPISPQSIAIKRIIYLANSEFFAIFSALLIGCFMVPKGKVIVSSVFLGMILIFVGMQATLTYNNISPIHDVMDWETYLSLGFNVLAAICNSLLVIFNKINETNFQKVRLDRMKDV
jgi:hypothetical protein